MTELERISCAKTYIEKLANGIDPLTNQSVPEGECINHVDISRCLFYVSTLLGQLAEQGGLPQKKAKTVKAPFSVDPKACKNFRFSETPISISEITKRINELICPEEMEKVTYKQLLSWLIRSGFLRLISVNGKMTRTPTSAGTALGILEEARQSRRGPYTLLVYNKNAQQFILDHLDIAIGFST